MFYKEKLKKARVLRKLSQEKLGGLIGKTKKTICRWEAGFNEPSSYYIKLLANVLSIPLSELSDMPEQEKLLPYFYTQLDSLDKHTFDFSSKTDTEKMELFIDMQNNLEMLSWENKYYKSIFTRNSDIVQALNLLVYEKDSKERFTFVNNYFFSYFNFLNEKMVLGLRNQNIWKQKNSWDDLTKIETEVYSSGCKVLHRKVSIPKPFGPDGKGFASVTPILDGNGKVEKIVGSIYELTGEEVLREKFFYIETILDNLEHVLWIVKLKPHRHYLYISKAVHSIYDVYAPEFYKNVNKWQNFILHEDRKKVLFELQSGKTEQHYRIRTGNGQIKWIEHFTYITEINGEKFEFGVIKDITEIKNAREALELLELNVNAMDNGLMIIDTNSEKVIYLNKAITKITGYPANTILKGGINFWKENIIHPEDIQKYSLSFEQEEKAALVECRIVMKNGDVRWIRNYWYSNSFMNKKCYIAIITDITEEKEAENIREILQINVEAMTDGLFVAEIDSGNYIFINEAIGRTYGYPVENFYKGGREFWRQKCLHPDFLSEHARKVPHTDNAQRYRFKIIRSDSSIRWIDSTVNTKVVHGKRCFISIEKDITDIMTEEDNYGLLKTVSDSAPYGVLIFNINSKQITYVNKFLSELTGYSCNDFLDKGISLIAEALICKEDKDVYNTFISKNESLQNSLHIHDANGDIKKIIVSKIANKNSWSDIQALTINKSY